MSTDISRGPRVCPSCGKENPPTAARCWLCFTPLGGAFQTTTAPAPGEWRFTGPPRTQPTAGSGSGCATVGAWVGIPILTILSAGVTFFLVCSASLGVESVLPASTFGRGEEAFILGMFCPAGVAAVVAAVAVATLIIVAFVRRQRR